MKTLEDIEIKERNTIEMNVETSTDETNVMWYKVRIIFLSFFILFLKDSFIFRMESPSKKLITVK